MPEYNRLTLYYSMSHHILLAQAQSPSSWSLYRAFWDRSSICRRPIVMLHFTPCAAGRRGFQDALQASSPGPWFSAHCISSLPRGVTKRLLTPLVHLGLPYCCPQGSIWSLIFFTVRCRNWLCRYRRAEPLPSTVPVKCHAMRDACDYLQSENRHYLKNGKGHSFIPSFIHSKLSQHSRVHDPSRPPRCPLPRYTSYVTAINLQMSCQTPLGPNMGRTRNESNIHK